MPTTYLLKSICDAKTVQMHKGNTMKNIKSCKKICMSFITKFCKISTKHDFKYSQ